MKVLLASLKTLTNCKNCSVSRIKFLFRHSFALIGRFFPVYIHSGRISQLVSDFKEVSRNFILDFLKKLKILKTISAYSTSTLFIFRTLKQNIHLVTLSL